MIVIRARVIHLSQFDTPAYICFISWQCQISTKDIGNFPERRSSLTESGPTGSQHQLSLKLTRDRDNRIHNILFLTGNKALLDFKQDASSVGSPRPILDLHTLDSLVSMQCSCATVTTRANMNRDKAPTLFPHSTCGCMQLDVGAN